MDKVTKNKNITKRNITKVKTILIRIIKVIIKGGTKKDITTIFKLTPFKLYLWYLQLLV